MTATRSLTDLCRGYADAPSLPIRHISLDSRRVEADGLFLACAGRRTHGLRGLGEACSRGARAILWEPAEGIEPPTPRDDVFMAPVAELSRHASAIAGRFHGDPSAVLAVAGITGTNGKTTTSWLIAMAMQQVHRRAGYIGTLGCGVPGEALVGGEYTTEDGVSVQQRLADLLASKAECVTMEVSSHALDQFRVEAVRYRAVAFTNLTRDHLDYHGTMENYAAAKARLFELSPAAARVINVDDPQGAQWAVRQAALGQAPLVVTARTNEGRTIAELCAVCHSRTMRMEAADIERHDRGLRVRFQLGLGLGIDQLRTTFQDHVPALLVEFARRPQFDFHRGVRTQLEVGKVSRFSQIRFSAPLHRPFGPRGDRMLVSVKVQASRTARIGLPTPHRTSV